MNKEILVKYIADSCSDEEFEAFAHWVEEAGEQEEDKEWIYEHWKAFNPEQTAQHEVKYDTLLDKIHHKINLQNTVNKAPKRFTFSTLGSWFSRAAAILFIPLLGLVVYLLSVNNFQNRQFAAITVDSLEIVSPIGSQTILQLSDGTEVTLNYGSRMKYPRNFSGDTREITLSGEAYFNVAHNPEKPFVVKTRELNVTALGTAFNVHAYNDDATIATTLVEGKVVVDKMLPDNSMSRMGIMVPGQHMQYNKNTNQVKSTKGNIEKYIAWTEGKMVFDNSPITTVAKELSRKFNVDIEVAEDIRELTYTVTFANDPLSLILDLMSETTPVVYKRFPRKKLPDGTFSKLKIKLERRT